MLNGNCPGNESLTIALTMRPSQPFDEFGNLSLIIVRGGSEVSGGGSCIL